MKISKFNIIFAFLILNLCLSTTMIASTTITLPCQSTPPTDGWIGIDRKAFPYPHSQGYAHDFLLPTMTDPCEKIVSIEVTLTIFGSSINLPAGCTQTNIPGNPDISPYFINAYIDCPWIPGGDYCSNTIFGQGYDDLNSFPNPFVFDCPWSGNSVDFGDTFSFDIVPPLNDTTCPLWNDAINQGFISIDYQICVDVIIDNVSCGSSGCLDPGAPVMLPCSTGDPCMENEMRGVLACDKTIECIPCGGGNAVSDTGACNTDCNLGNLEVWNSTTCQCEVSVITVPGCDDPASCNYNPLANCDDGSCLPAPVCNTDICVGDIEIVDPSSPCNCIVDQVQILGCTTLGSCNYDPLANCDDGSCLPVPVCNTDICTGDTEMIDPTNPCNCIVDEVQVLGCMNTSSCNYNPLANCDDGTCQPPITCNTNICLGDTEIIDPSNPCNCIVDEVRVFGCTDASACNYDPAANCDDGTCQTAPVCNTNICLGDTEIIDPSNPCNCIVDEVRVFGCTDAFACNYDPLANCDDGTCQTAPVCNTDICVGDVEIVDPSNPCSCIVDEITVLGCMDASACNYNPLANCDDGTCQTAPVCNTDICVGDIEIIDPSNPCNCIIDQVQVLGCTTLGSCNYDPLANCDDGSCQSAPVCNTDICLGNTEIIDPSNLCNCILDQVQVLGCMDPLSANYNPLANCDDSSCDCVPDGCTDPNACNYDPAATCNDGSCIPSPVCNTNICAGDTEIIDPSNPCNCIIDQLQVLGCTTLGSCNYNPLANCDDGSCQPAPVCNTDICSGDTEIVDLNDPCNCITDVVQVLGCTNPLSANYDPLANCDDNSCDCVPDGCTDINACNYDPSATCDDGSCLPVPACNTDICLGDTEIVDPSDPCNCITDEVQVLGCTNPQSPSYDPLANCDDNSCDCVPDGCTDINACNYDPAATCDDGSCIQDDCNSGPTTVQPCNDMNNNTINDVVTILDCDGSICIPCAGTLVDCNTGTTSILPCDDDNDCTDNDVQTVLDGLGTICQPCEGVIIDCDSANATMTIPCDDNMVNTINDLMTILICDNAVCVPCQGTPVDCTTSPTFDTPCDDGLPCTTDDMQTILLANGEPCGPCMGQELTCANGGSTSIIPCDDEDANTVNDMATILDCDGSECIPCAGVICDETNTTMMPCDDNDDCTMDDVVIVLIANPDVICQPCQGIVIDCNSPTFAEQTCDDGNECTVNDVQYILACDGTICEPCIGQLIDCETGESSVQPCDDGDPQTVNDVETVLACDGSVCIPCAGEVSTTIFTSTVFSPNATEPDNRFLVVLPSVYTEGELSIFDRWGNQVYNSTSDFSWDGTVDGRLMQSGVYVYVLSYNDIDGNAQVKYGDVALIY